MSTLDWSKYSWPLRLAQSFRPWRTTPGPEYLKALFTNSADIILQDDHYL